MDTLKETNIPVSHATYNQTDDVYIVFMEYNQMPSLIADDEERYTAHSFQVDVFSKGNYLELVKDVKSRLKKAGFRRMFESETYDENMQRFRKILRVSYISKGEN